MFKRNIISALAACTFSLILFTGTNAWAQKAKLTVGGNATAKDSIKTTVITAKTLKVTGGNSPATFDSVKVLGLAGIGNRMAVLDANGNLKAGGLAILTAPWEMGGNSSVTPSHFLGTLNNADLIFKTNVTANPAISEKMRIKSNGAVGIGTNNPLVPLHLLSTGSNYNCATVFRMQHIFSGPANGCTSNHDFSWDLKATQANTFEIGVANAANPVISLNNAGNALFFGKIGVGNSAPVCQVDVDAQQNVNGICIETNHTSPFGFNLRTTVDNIDTKGLSVYNPSLNPNIDAFVVWGDGRTGINATHVPAGYMLAVGGKAIATEYVVRLVQDWPDYVFNKNYKLKSLNELEKFVKANNHLPGIPTAKEIKESGVSLGDMVTKQMEKIEELSLYLIEINKKVDALQAENKQLKASIKK